MEWYQAVIVFAVAFAVAYCMVPVSKKIAFRIGAIDYPASLSRVAEASRCMLG